jgi:nucleotide-binding universal stress UspA family protein
MAQEVAAEVHVLHVVRMPIAAEGAPLYAELYTEQTRLARETVAELAAKHFSHVPSESRVEVGDPGAIIIAAALKLPADLVVMATHGRRGFSRLFLGSVAEAVMRAVPCAVLTAKHHTSDAHTVERWMTKHLFTINSRENLNTACAYMQEYRIRSLPVVENEKLVGIVIDRDVRTHLNYLESIEISKVMRADVITVTPETSIWDAARLLRERKVGALPVLDKERLVGIVSTSDLLEALTELQ